MTSIKNVPIEVTQHNSEMKSVMISIHVYFILVYICVVFASFCDNDKCLDDKPCQWISADQPSIVVKGTSGRFGNALFSYIVLLTYKLKYGLRVYFPANKRKLISDMFDNLEIQAAEDHICHFKEDFQVFWDNHYSSKMNKIQDHLNYILPVSPCGTTDACVSD